MTDLSSSRQFAMLILRILVYLSYAMLLATSERTYLYVYFFFYIECIGFVWSERGLKVTAPTFKSHFRKYVSVVHVFTISSELLIFLHPSAAHLQSPSMLTGTFPPEHRRYWARTRFLLHILWGFNYFSVPAHTLCTHACVRTGYGPSHMHNEWLNTAYSYWQRRCKVVKSLKPGVFGRLLLRWKNWISLWNKFHFFFNLTHMKVYKRITFPIGSWWGSKAQHASKNINSRKFWRPKMERSITRNHEVKQASRLEGIHFHYCL